VLYPGWFVPVTPAGLAAEVWVHNEEYFRKLVTGLPRVLTAKEVALYAAQVREAARRGEEVEA